LRSPIVSVKRTKKRAEEDNDHFTNENEDDSSDSGLAYQDEELDAGLFEDFEEDDAN
jgi:hypothetical protein